MSKKPKLPMSKVRAEYLNGLFKAWYRDTFPEFGEPVGGHGANMRRAWLDGWVTKRDQDLVAVDSALPIGSDACDCVLCEKLRVVKAQIAR